MCVGRARNPLLSEVVQAVKTCLNEVKLDTLLLSSSITAWVTSVSSTKISYCVEHASVISGCVIARLGKMRVDILGWFMSSKKQVY